jgi:hypothetical protein
MNGFVEEAANDLRPAEPARIAPALTAGLKHTDQLIMQVKGSQMTASEKYDVLHELRIKREQFNTALLRALNITLEAGGCRGFANGYSGAEVRRYGSFEQCKRAAGSIGVAYACGAGRQKLADSVGNGASHHARGKQACDCVFPRDGPGKCRDYEALLYAAQCGARFGMFRAKEW